MRLSGEAGIGAAETRSGSDFRGEFACSHLQLCTPFESVLVHNRTRGHPHQRLKSDRDAGASRCAAAVHPATALLAAEASCALLLLADSRQLAKRAPSSAAAQLPFLLPPGDQPVQLGPPTSEPLIATGDSSSSVPGSIATSGSDAETSSASESCATKVTEDACGDLAYTPPSPEAPLPLHRLPDARPRVSKRRFRSALVEAEMERLAGKVADPALRRIWMNSLPKSLDTTVSSTDLQLEEADHTKSFSHHRRHRGELAARSNLAAPAVFAIAFRTSSTARSR